MRDKSAAIRVTKMLYIVSTPIGNLQDITLRALEILQSVDYIACEDTRQTIKLLNHYNIKKPLVSYHSYNLKQRGGQILNDLNSGKSIALVSDSGTPGISDPGARLISEAIKAGINICPIPGPSAAIAALSASGMPTDNFYFVGFLSSKQARRKNELEKLKPLGVTLVIYESPHRLCKALNDILDIYGNINICIARELTKKFEEVRRENVSSAIKHFGNTKPLGEFVIILGNSA